MLEEGDFEGVIARTQMTPALLPIEPLFLVVVHHSLAIDPDLRAVVGNGAEPVKTGVGYVQKARTAGRTKPVTNGVPVAEARATLEIENGVVARADQRQPVERDAGAHDAVTGVVTTHEAVNGPGGSGSVTQPSMSRAENRVGFFIVWEAWC